MSLIKISDTTASGQAEVVISGINSTYNVYKLVITNLSIATDNKNITIQVTTGGTADSDSEYDIQAVTLKEEAAHSVSSGTNGSSFTIAPSMGDQAGEVLNAVIYLFNFANSGEHSHVVFESVHVNKTPNVRGYHGAVVHTVAEANDGLSFTGESSANLTGRFQLYGLTK
jgi:hypothetical protein|tara:strand:- start:45 stop:554 length:510 start_codon:yes stop_codon:yes gene_type:complete